MPAFYDFFRKIRFLPNDVVIEADSVTDEAKFQAGVNIAFDVEDSTTSPGATTDRVIFNGARYDTYVPSLGTLPGESAVIRLERDPLGVTGIVQTDIKIESDPLGPITVDRIDANTIRIGSTAPTLPFSQEQIEDFAAQLLLGGTHSEINVNYDDLGSPITGNLDLTVTSTLQQITNRGQTAGYSTTTNPISITNATGSTNSTTGALKVTGGLGVFENINAGQNISTATGTVSATRLISTVATGTAPLTVTSTTVVANLQAATASKWHNPITLSLTGEVTGSANIDGSGNVSISTTISTDTVTLGTDTTGNYVAAGAVSGNGLSGSASSEGATFTVSSNATALNTTETIVFRDASGNFAAGTITATLSGTATNATNVALTTSTTASAFKVPFANTTANTTSNYGLLQDSESTFTYNPSTNTLTVGTVSGALSGNATTATTLQTARNINGVSFNGSTDITISANTPNALTVGTGLQLDSGTTFNGSTARTISIDSTVATLTGVQTFTNKTFTDNTTFFQDDGDNTRKMQFQLSGITAGNTRTLTVPNASGTITLDGNAFFIGTTSVANNRTSGNLALTGITSIDGYAGGLAGGNNTTLLGAIPYQSNTNVTTLLAPNTTTTKQFLRQTGTGTNGSAPVWDTVTSTDVGLGNVTNESKTTMFTNPTFVSPAYGNASTTTDADATVDAATTSLYAYVVGASNTTRVISVTNLTPGRMVILYLRNLQLNPKIMNIAVSTSTSGFSNVNMSKGDAGGTSQTGVTLTGSGGTATITLFNANGVFCGSIS